MEIIRAEHSGFCFGVKKAVEAAYETIENAHGRPIYTHGQLIHNRDVTDELTAKGVSIIENLDEVPEGALLIVRSHGEPRNFYEEAEKRGIDLIDTTCPFVARIHELVHEADLKGTPVIIVGDPGHPEVTGTCGWCGNRAWIFRNSEEAASFPLDHALLVCQTTIRKEVLDGVVRVLLDKGVRLDVRNTICNATSERQKSAAELAAKVDSMVVIGGRNSSNTGKLYEICKNSCERTYFVENINDLPLKELKTCNKIGITAGASTPERIIKEVISDMSEGITNEKEVNSMADFMDEIDASLKLPHVGEIVTGTVVEVNDDEVIINLGCKKDGILRAGEVSLEEGQTLSDVFKEGDEIETKVLKTDDNDGGVLLSKKKLELNTQWKEIEAACENKTNIEVRVSRIVKGGVIAQYKDLSGFIPLSQLSNRYVESADEFLNETLTVKVSRTDPRRNRAVFSHKAVLAEERQKRLDEIWDTLKVDDVVEGTVMRFTDYGAFVDLGGIDGLLHISEISWGKLRHPDEVLSIGQKINVKILNMNRDKGKISLGLKQTTPEPWSVIGENYHIDDIVKGKVVQLKEYGAFVELEPGLDGLVHISEVANKHVNNIGDELTVGQTVLTKILDIDVDRRRISLSIKQAPELPAEEEPESDEYVKTEEAEAVAAEPVPDAAEVSADIEDSAVTEEVEAAETGEEETAAE